MPQRHALCLRSGRHQQETLHSSTFTPARSRPRNANSSLSLAGAPSATLELVQKQRKAVRQLAVLASTRVVVALCNGIVSVHGLDSLAELCTLNNNATRAEASCSEPVTCNL